MQGHFDFIDDPEENNLTPAYVASHTRITLKLKNIDELSFASLRPTAHLKGFVDNLTKNPGPSWIQGEPQ